MTSTTTTAAPGHYRGIDIHTMAVEGLTEHGAKLETVSSYTHNSAHHPNSTVYWGHTNPLTTAASTLQSTNMVLAGDTTQLWQ
jgi:hypothetical protein